MFGCSSDEEQVIDESCVPETDQTNINASLNTIPQCMTQIENGAAMNILNDFVTFNNGESIEMFDTDEIETWGTNIAKIIQFITLDVEGWDDDGDGWWDDVEWVGDTYQFDFLENRGTYTWNPWSDSYDVNLGGNSINIEFPSNPDQNSNNATFRMSEYVDYQWQPNDGEEVVYWPTSMYCELEVDNEVIFSIDHSASFNDSFEIDGEEVPNSISIEVFINPATIQLQAERENNMFFSAGLSINSSTCSISADIETQLLTTNYTDILNDGDSWMEDMDYISLDISVEDLTLDGTLDCQVLYDLSDGDDPSMDDVNTAGGVDVIYQGNETASLKLVETDPDEISLYIVYCDDSQESVSAYINPLMNSVETVLYPYAGSWWDNID